MNLCYHQYIMNSNSIVIHIAYLFLTSLCSAIIISTIGPLIFVLRQILVTGSFRHVEFSPLATVQKCYKQIFCNCRLLFIQIKSIFSIVFRSVVQMSDFSVTVSFISSALPVFFMSVQISLPLIHGIIYSFIVQSILLNMFRVIK